MHLFLTNTQHFTSQDINWWTGVMWVIVMFLSAVWSRILTAPIHCRRSIGRAVRYDDIYRMDEIKSLSFHILLYRLFRGVAKYIVYGNTFSSFGWLQSLHATTGREGETEAGGSEQEHYQPGQNEELVPKRGTTSVAWTRVFKHSRFKTSDFKPLKHKRQSYMLYSTLCFCVRGARIFLPLYWLWTIT